MQRPRYIPAENNFNPNDSQQIHDLDRAIKILKSNTSTCLPILPLLGLGLMAYGLIDFLAIMLRTPEVASVMDLLPQSVKDQIMQFANTSLTTYGNFIEPNTSITCQNVLPIDNICQDVTLPSLSDEFLTACFNFVIQSCKSLLLLQLQALQTSTGSPANPLHHFGRLLLDFLAFAAGATLLVAGLAKCGNSLYLVSDLPHHQFNKIQRFRETIGHGGNFLTNEELLVELEAIRDTARPRNQQQKSWCNLFSSCAPKPRREEDIEFLLEDPSAAAPRSLSPTRGGSDSA